MSDIGLGHNQPPPDSILRAQALVSTANRWVAERPVLKSAEEAALCDSYIAQLRDCRDDLDAALKTERGPLDAEIAAIKLKYADPAAMIRIALDKVRPLATAWLARMQARLDEERARAKAEAAREQQRADQLRAAAAKPGATIEEELAATRAQEAAEAAARTAARPPERARVKGEMSDKAMSLREYWSAEITDEDVALAHYKHHPAVRAASLAAILKLGNEHARKAKDASAAPPGVRFLKREQAQ